MQPSTSGVEYSNGVSGIWVHLSEAREFARRAKLAGGSLLASVLREDLFQLVRPFLPCVDSRTDSRVVCNPRSNQA